MSKQKTTTGIKFTYKPNGDITCVQSGDLAYAPSEVKNRIVKILNNEIRKNQKKHEQDR